MSEAHQPDPNRTLRYPLSWPAWLSEQVAEAANARAMSVATWLREAAQEKLERTDGKRHQPVGKRVVRHEDGDRTNNDLSNLKVAEAPEAER